MSIRNIFNQIARAVRGGQTLDLTSGDTLTLTGNLLVTGTINGGGNILGPSMASFILNPFVTPGGVSVGHFIWTNTTGGTLIMRSVQYTASVVSTAAATMDLRKSLAGNNGPGGGTDVALISTPIVLNTQAANIAFSPTNAAIANRTFAANDKISVLFSAAPTNWQAALTIQFYQV